MHPIQPRPPETRSWEPPAVKIDPLIKARPSNQDLAKQGNQLHECLEGLKLDHNRRLGRVERDIRAVKEALGVGDIKKKTLATQTPRAAWWRTFAATGGAIAAAGVVLRTSEVIWPWVKGAAMAIYHAMLAGRL
jgi:hypothetical protein